MRGHVGASRGVLAWPRPMLHVKPPPWFVLVERKRKADEEQLRREEEKEKDRLLEPCYGLTRKKIKPTAMPESSEKASSLAAPNL